jgi:hypothetical protein
MGMRAFEVHVERGRITGAGPAEISFTAPEFHAALVIRIENPHARPPLRGVRFSQAISLQAEMIRARRAWKANVINSGLYAKNNQSLKTLSSLRAS